MALVEVSLTCAPKVEQNYCDHASGKYLSGVFTLERTAEIWQGHECRSNDDKHKRT